MESIDRYRRYLKRRNFSSHTIKSYLNILAQFIAWLTVPLHETTRHEIDSYVDHLMGKRLSPKTITCHLQTIRLFFAYLIDDEGLPIPNPITKVSIRLPKPLPRHLQDDQVRKFLAVITDPRDRAMVMLMLRCGLRVEEVSHLTLDAVELSRNRIFIKICPRSLYEGPFIQGTTNLPCAEGTFNRDTAIRQGHPEEDRILCPGE
jgi:site-specific recombinase XerD